VARSRCALYARFFDNKVFIPPVRKNGRKLAGLSARAHGGFSLFRRGINETAPNCLTLGYHNIPANLAAGIGSNLIPAYFVSLRKATLSPNLYVFLGAPSRSCAAIFTARSIGYPGREEEGAGREVAGMCRAFYEGGSRERSSAPSEQGAPNLPCVELICPFLPSPSLLPPISVAYSYPACYPAPDGSSRYCTASSSADH